MLKNTRGRLFWQLAALAVIVVEVPVLFLLQQNRSGRHLVDLNHFVEASALAFVVWLAALPFARRNAARTIQKAILAVAVITPAAAFLVSL